MPAEEAKKEIKRAREEAKKAKEEAEKAKDAEKAMQDLKIGGRQFLFADRFLQKIELLTNRLYRQRG